MILTPFKKRDIDEMDVNNIPIRFKNYFNSLDDSEKSKLVSSRPDLAEALNFVPVKSKPGNMPTEASAKFDAHTSKDKYSSFPKSSDIYHIESDEIVFASELWTKQNPLCPYHRIRMDKQACSLSYKDRILNFDAFLCKKCNSIHLTKTDYHSIVEKCSEKGIKVPKFKEIIKKPKAKQSTNPQRIMPHYIIENGKKEEYPYSKAQDWIQLTEKDTIVISDCLYCDLEEHQTEEMLVVLDILERISKRRKKYLLKMGYCSDCQKYYVDYEDFKIIKTSGRPEVTVLSEMDDDDFQITSGETFNLENRHLGLLERRIQAEIDNIHNSSDYVSRYQTSTYDDGDLIFAKARSKRKYGQRLEELTGYQPRPYFYRVDIASEDQNETYYIGMSDIILNNGKQVISANSDFGRELINYQTAKIEKDGKEYHISLTREFDIEKAMLFGYVNLRTDEDAVFKKGITDPFLIRVLNMRKRQHNLTDIFVTIQENQNQIVNFEFKRNLIVQGCAGSGKTMVLLHRLSSLQYRQRYFDFSENALILTPNETFNLHIKGLADSLQIGGIQRLSVEQYYLDMLRQYDEELLPERKIVSERLVPSQYVNYIYSDQFLVDFERKFSEVICERNALVGELNLLSAAMGEPQRNIEISDCTKVIPQLEHAIRSLKGKIERKEIQIDNAKKDLDRHLNRKAFLEKTIEENKEKSAAIVQESLTRVRSKIGYYLSERQYEKETLQEDLKTLNAKRTRYQNALILFRRTTLLAEVDNDISEIKKKIEIMAEREEIENHVLLASQEDQSDDQILLWMEQVAYYVKEVKDDIRLCHRIRNEHARFTQEMLDIDNLISESERKYEAEKSEDYSSEIRIAVEKLEFEIAKYSLLNIFRMIFDKTVEDFKRANGIGNITGKYHRYDLYARLIFAEHYYGKVYGSAKFICVDEGQDLALNEYKLILRLNQKQAIFNIFGDVNQLIEKGRGISNWKSVEEVFDAKKFVLNENYRNTNQITRFCNEQFNMRVLQTGVDGARIKNISMNEFGRELSDFQIGRKRVAILISRSTVKINFMKMDCIPWEMRNIIGERVDNGLIALMYVDEVKGIEFDRVYVFEDQMERNERYIAYTRALSELVRVHEDFN